MTQRYTPTGILAAAMLLILGCQGKNKTDNQLASTSGSYDSLMPVDSYSQPSSDEPYRAASDSTYEDASSYDSATAGQVYTVKRKDTLYSIARAFYNGDHTKWRDIYEANRQRISDPNHIAVGMKLIIPTH